MQDIQSKTHDLNQGCTIWFTGLSGAGKSTLSEALKRKLDIDLGDNRKVFILDGDIIRTGLNKDLGFSAEDRAENIRRISEVAKLFALAGQICFSPYEKDRDFARRIHKEAGLPFVECHIAASLQVCEQRDVKGLYAKARAGIIKNFTGISDPYEAPSKPELKIETGSKTIDECITEVKDYLKGHHVIEQITDSNRKLSGTHSASSGPGMVVDQ